MNMARTKGIFEVIGVWCDNGDVFQAIISDDIVISPDMNEGDKALLCDLTEHELRNEGNAENAMFDILSINQLSTLN